MVSFQYHTRIQGKISDDILKHLMLCSLFHSSIVNKSLTFCKDNSPRQSTPFSKNVRLIIERFVVTFGFCLPRNALMSNLPT